ncbi:unnamed protein product, partial [Protopolystoma xenopodis]
MAKFLQETLVKTKGSGPSPQTGLTLNQFHDLLKQVRESGRLADPKDIARFSALFEDNVTLESLDRKHLKALCSLLEVSSIGPSRLLRFQLGLRVRQLKAEDLLVRKEGVDKIPPWELQSLCRERGMRAIGMTEERLRTQLRQWLELHLEKNVPITLLLISRVMYLTETLLPDAQQLQLVIAKLPKAVSEQVVINVVEASSPDALDVHTKIEILKQEQKNIKEERKAKLAEAAEEAMIASASASKLKIHTNLELSDKAPLLKGLKDEVLANAETNESREIADSASNVAPLAGARQTILAGHEIGPGAASSLPKLKLKDELEPV